MAAKTLFLTLILLIAGCGGSGGGGVSPQGGINPVVARFESLMSAVNSETLSATMANFHPLYQNQTLNYAGVQAYFTDKFSRPNYHETWSNLRITEVRANAPSDGYLRGVYRVETNDNGVITVDDLFAVDMVFAQDGTVWKLRGG